MLSADFGYSYDEVGNRLSKESVLGDLIDTEQYEYDAVNHSKHIYCIVSKHYDTIRITKFVIETQLLFLEIFKRNDLQIKLG
jgi:hypothetical protein